MLCAMWKTYCLLREMYSSTDEKDFIAST
jgi:hypothetical protein